MQIDDQVTHTHLYTTMNYHTFEQLNMQVTAHVRDQVRHLMDQDVANNFWRSSWRQFVEHHGHLHEH
jgi:hypothetical protein